MNFKTNLNNMQPKKIKRGNKFIKFLEFPLEPETLGLWGSLDEE
jgi:hypothetical protein